jgi:hypothetical protein
MTAPAADAARSAAVALAPELGPDLPAEVEAALVACQAAGQRPGQYDPIAAASLSIETASLIVSIAQLAWSIVSDRRKHAAEPSSESIARQVRIALRQQDIPLPPSTGRITDVVITEIIRRERPLP